MSAGLRSGLLFLCVTALACAGGAGSLPDAGAASFIPVGECKIAPPAVRVASMKGDEQPVGISPDQRTVVFRSTTEDTPLRAWSVDTGAVHTIAEQAPRDVWRPDEIQAPIAFSADSAHAIALDHCGRYVRDEVLDVDHVCNVVRIDLDSFSGSRILADVLWSSWRGSPDLSHVLGITPTGWRGEPGTRGAFDGILWWWSAATGMAVKVAEQVIELSLEMSPTGDRAVFSVRDGPTLVLSLADGRVSVLSELPLIDMRAPVFSPDGSQVAITTSRGLEVHRFTDGASTVFAGETRALPHQFVPERNLILYHVPTADSYFESLRIGDLARSRVIPVGIVRSNRAPENRGGEERAFPFYEISPDRRWIVFSSSDTRDFRILDLISFTSRRVLDTRRVSNPRLSYDGKILYFRESVPDDVKPDEWGWGLQDSQGYEWLSWFYNLETGIRWHPYAQLHSFPLFPLRTLGPPARFVAELVKQSGEPVKPSIGIEDPIWKITDFKTGAVTHLPQCENSGHSDNHSSPDQTVLVFLAVEEKWGIILYYMNLVTGSVYEARDAYAFENTIVALDDRIAFIQVDRSADPSKPEDRIALFYVPIVR